MPDGDGGSYYFLVTMAGTCLTLASHCCEMRNLGTRDAIGVPSALAILAEAVRSANGVLAELDSVIAAGRQNAAAAVPVTARSGQSRGLRAPAALEVHYHDSDGEPCACAMPGTYAAVNGRGELIRPVLTAHTRDVILFALQEVAEDRQELVDKCDDPDHATGPCPTCGPRAATAAEVLAVADIIREAGTAAADPDACAECGEESAIHDSDYRGGASLPPVPPAGLTRCALAASWCPLP